MSMHLELAPVLCRASDVDFFILFSGFPTSVLAGNILFPTFYLLPPESLKICFIEAGLYHVGCVNVIRVLFSLTFLSLSLMYFTPPALFHVAFVLGA